MTKKDFEFVANTINTIPHLNDDDQARVTSWFAVRLAKENPRFDMARFIKACTKETV